MPSGKIPRPATDVAFLYASNGPEFSDDTLQSVKACVRACVRACEHMRWYCKFAATFTTKPIFDR